ncbi:hypothetical protein Ahy_A03g012721 [Arachis hypogaea]|uniref:Endonuclease/exonuclease/phosphatase domain-containing protein n=1 Tax=Arachis hypogaea TaxID=3818 RepID=A0A445DU00_ARAHY|nr:hypothetical protein Ahy_A03g012721 [Arachis hypogaea]
MNIISWNCRGASAKGFHTTFLDLNSRYKSNFCILLETHISGKKAKNVIKNLGFDAWCISEAEGFSGGIWCLWKSAFWKVKPILTHKQLVHLEVQWENEDPWFFTAVYGSLQTANRRVLWEMIEDIAANTNGPWCLGGDFNSILSLEDSGGSSNLSIDTTRFLNCINTCGLNDLNFSGPPFTWQRNNVKRRLDRYLSNLDFTDRFKEVGVKHLTKLKSDHLPILLDFQMAHLEEVNKPFRFLAPWVLHEDYNNLVKRSWDNRNNFTQNIANFTQEVKIWNREVFGHIFRKKQRILSRLEGITKNLTFNPNPFLDKLQKELWLEYEGIAVQEEVYWQ